VLDVKNADIEVEEKVCAHRDSGGAEQQQGQ
jgi:hypothetical protein